MSESRKTQLKSALVASIFLLPAIYFLTDSIHLLIGFAVGLVYSNGFEYFFHRWALHRSGSMFAPGHTLHHESSGKPDQEEHLNFFSGSPLHIVILFLVNMAPFVLIELFGIRIFSGVLIGFVTYFVGMEEIHRRAHTGFGWIPRSWRKHHMVHHGHGPDANEDTNFNIFFPLFDWLLRTKQG